MMKRYKNFKDTNFHRVKRTKHPAKLKIQSKNNQNRAKQALQE